jgi:diacylglycerol kinase family enzyme
MMDLTLDNRERWSVPTLMLSVLVGLREGSFVMAPRARLDDGLLDYVQAESLSRWEVLRFLPRLALWGPPTDHPKLRQGRCQQLSVCSAAPLTVHVDGEFFSRPQDNVRSLAIHVLPRALRVQLFPV